MSGLGSGDGVAAAGSHATMTEALIQRRRLSTTSIDLGDRGSDPSPQRLLSQMRLREGLTPDAQRIGSPRGWACGSGLRAACQLLEASELGERIGVIVDPDVEQRPVLIAVDEQRRRLLPTLVAAGLLGCLHGRHQPLRQRQLASRLVGRGHGLEHVRARQDVARHRIGLLDQMAAPFLALRTRVRGEPAHAVHEVHLADLLLLVGGDQQAHGIGGRGPGRQQRQPTRAVAAVDPGLAGDGADAGADVGHARPGRQRPAGHRDADLPVATSWATMENVMGISGIGRIDRNLAAGRRTHARCVCA